MLASVNLFRLYALYPGISGVLDTLTVSDCFLSLWAAYFVSGGESEEKAHLG